MESKAFFNDLRASIQNDRFKEALERLENYIEGAGIAEYYRNEIIGQTARINANKKSHRRGEINAETFNTNATKLRYNLLDLIDEIENEKVKVVSADKDDVENIPSDIKYEVAQFNIFKNISWLNMGLENARSVCKIEVREKQAPNGATGKMVGTGFLIGNNLMMTNNHVIGNIDEAKSCVIFFNYQKNIKGQEEPVSTYKLAPDQLFHTNPSLDYTIVKLADESEKPLSAWGIVDVKFDKHADVPGVGDHVTIIQHPRGAHKQIALNENQITKIDSPYILYLTDTERGSSGSPVFNDNWKVIALHHAAVPVKDPKGVKKFHNRGVFMTEILADLASAGISLD